MNQKNAKQSQKPRTSKLAKISLMCILTSICLFVLFVYLRFVNAHNYIGKHFVISIFVAVPVTSFMGLILGIAALIQICKSNVPLSGSGLAVIATVLSIIFILFISPNFTPYRPPSRLVCASTVKGLSTVIKVYAYDYNDRLPTIKSWCDLLIAHADVPPTAFVCPESDTKEGQSSYAFNINVDRMNLSQIPPDVVLVFETKPGWNQVGGPELLTTDNHKGRGCNIGFADGHTEFVKTEDLDTLRWEP
jgi:prepilin-type processing-associated H-X9-DG protein